MSEKNIYNKEEFVPPFDAIKVAYYRGIGKEQTIGPLGQMNVFIGENNAGKSIVLNLVHDYVPQIIKRKVPSELKKEEQYRGDNARNFECAFGIRRADYIKYTHDFFLDLEKCRKLNVPAPEELNVSGLFPQEYIWSLSAQKYDRQKLKDFLKKIVAGLSLQEVSSFVVSLGGPGFFQREQGLRFLVDSLLERYSPDLSIERAVLKTGTELVVRHIPAIRNIEYLQNTQKDNYLSGQTLLKELLPLHSPRYDDDISREKFKKITSFLQQVLGKKKVELEIPHDRTSIQINIDDKILPLESLGTGIKELVIIAAYCTIYDGDIICIEEPEIHLHPKLQRQLVRYLIENTTSQYFIATHSNVFIDMKEANLFRVSNDGVETHIEHLPDAIQKRGVLDDLGYLASDLLQTNYIIWVEGPSDRIYLRHWISLIDDGLQEGIDYSIMFYGGALIKYLSVSDEENETINEQEFSDFIKLLQINRNMTILMDRDCPHDEEGFKPAVRRIKKELEDNSEAFWVTFGREVENYVEKDRLQEVIKSNHSGSYKEAPADLDQLDSHLFQYLVTGTETRKEDGLRDADKIKLANKICEKSLDWEDFYLATDLQEKVKTLVKRIKKANGIEIQENDLLK